MGGQTRRSDAKDASRPVWPLPTTLAAGLRSVLLLLCVGPFVTEQLRFVEVLQDLPVGFDVAVVEFGRDAGGEPGGAGADAGDVAGDLADAQAGRVVEAVDVREEWCFAGVLLGELEVRAEIWAGAEFGVREFWWRRVAIGPGGDCVGEGGDLWA